MLKKRGRKNVEDGYFGPNEEMAVARFLGTDEIEEKSRIYKESLEAPMIKLVESIIRTYKLYRKGYTFEEVRDDAISYIVWKSGKFKVDLNKKAYSYYGTICKHYILALIQKDEKSLKRNASFEDAFPSIEERDDLIYQLSDDEYSQDDLIKDISNKIKKEMESDSTNETTKKKKLTENERKVGKALVELLDNWEKIFESPIIDGEDDFNQLGGPKYNKNIILATIRNYTNLTTKDIRLALKRYKDLYNLLKRDKIDDGYL